MLSQLILVFLFSSREIVCLVRWRLTFCISQECILRCGRLIRLFLPLHSTSALLSKPLNVSLNPLCTVSGYYLHYCVINCISEGWNLQSRCSGALTAPSHHGVFDHYWWVWESSGSLLCMLRRPARSWPLFHLWAFLEMLFAQRSAIATIWEVGCFKRHIICY